MSLLSGNTFGAKQFSDGKQVARMLPEFPNLTKCKKCNTIFWLNKLKEIGSYRWGEENSKWAKADSAEFLTIEEYFIAITKGVAENKGEELFIRQHLWWVYNDRIRNGQKIFNDKNDEMRWKKNLIELLNLLNRQNIFRRILNLPNKSAVNDKIMKAEIYRNLGDFENCIRIIQSIDNQGMNWLKVQFVKECERKNRWVIEF
jgi:hypothetical protein